MTLITTADATGMLEMAIESDEQVAFATHSSKAKVSAQSCCGAAVKAVTQETQGHGMWHAL